MIYGLLDLAGVGFVYALAFAFIAGLAYLAFFVLRAVFFLIRDIFFETRWASVSDSADTIESVETLRRELRDDPETLKKRFDDLMSRRGTEWEIYRQMETIRAFRRLHRAEWRQYNKLGLL